MFPTGSAGIALLVLRISIAVNLVVDGTAHGVLVKPLWLVPGLVVPALSLCVGLMTPYCAALSFLLQVGLFLAFGGQNEIHLVLSLLNAGAVAVLGPGAYSIDARIFGRRLLTVPSQR